VRHFLLTLLLLLLLPSSALALGQSSIAYPQQGLTVNTRTVRYQIQGDTSEVLREQMKQLGMIDERTGIRYGGFTNWYYRWRTNYRFSSGKCRIKSAAIRLDLKYTLPRWWASSSASPELASEWNRFLAALRGHENGHGALAITGGRTMLKKLRGLAPSNSCSALTAAAKRTFVRENERIKTIETAYDTRTDHGATQGATLS
jgi:predicted secreted Zn-dependent protease